MSDYPTEQYESEYLHTAILEYQRDVKRLTVELSAAQARIAELEAAPTPLPRPDKPGDWWQWHKPTQQWILCHVTNLDYWGEALWLPATPPPAPKNQPE